MTLAQSVRAFVYRIVEWHVNVAMRRSALLPVNGLEGFHCVWSCTRAWFELGVNREVYTLVYVDKGVLAYYCVQAGFFFFWGVVCYPPETFYFCNVQSSLRMLTARPQSMYLTFCRRDLIFQERCDVGGGLKMPRVFTPVQRTVVDMH